MPKLPDFEGLAIFAKVVQMHSFVGAATELRLSKATVSKAISRIERKLGARLFNYNDQSVHDGCGDGGERLRIVATSLVERGWNAAEIGARGGRFQHRSKAILALGKFAFTPAMNAAPLSIEASVMLARLPPCASRNAAKAATVAASLPSVT